MLGLPGLSNYVGEANSDVAFLRLQDLLGSCAAASERAGESDARLVEAIHAVGRGQSLLDASVTRDVIERLAELGKAEPEPADVLSEREREVLLLVAQGLTKKEIAAKLFLSPYTARNHVIRILDKLGLSRRSEAAAQAVKLGLLE